MDELTSEQKTQLETWAGQRDAFLSELSTLQTASEGLQSKNKDLANSNTAIEHHMCEVQGRIEELKIRESELFSVIPKEVAFLESNKAVLQAEVSMLEKLIVTLTSQKESLENDIALELATFDTIKGETLLLDKVVDRVTTVSQGNINKIDLLVTNLATSLEEIIEVNRKNVFETNVVIEKLPAMIMEAQKHGLIKNKT
jgi:uncharacterized protein (DUF3084 family)